MKRNRARLVVGLAAVAIAAALFSTATITQAEPSGTSKMHVMRINNGQGPDSNNGDNGQAKGARPRPGGTNNLIYGGGAITQTPAVYIVYWGSEWSTGFTTGGYTSAQAQTYVQDFFNNVGGSSWNNSVTQYCSGVATGTINCGTSGTHITNPKTQLKGVWGDTSTAPSSPTQSQIAAEAVKGAAHFSASGSNAIVMVFTPHGKSMNGFGTQWCAWHSSTNTSSGQLGYAYIPYMPDAGTSCGMNFVNATNNSYGNGYFDGFSVVAGHEYAEAETDIFPSSAWVDSRGSENADKCAWSSSSGDISLGGNSYAVQPLWSNASGGGSCVMSY